MRMSFGKKGGLSVKGELLNPRANEKNQLRDHPEGQEGSSLEIDSSLSGDSLSEDGKLAEENNPKPGRRDTANFGEDAFKVPSVRRKNTFTSAKSKPSNIS